MEDSKEQDNKLIDHGKTMERLTVAFQENLERERERNGEQENKIKEGLFEVLLVHLWLQSATVLAGRLVDFS